MADADESLICERAEAFIKEHEIVGIQRIFVGKIGAHWWNRRSLPVSGKYVHGLWKGILERQGFVVSRYIKAIVIECNSEPWKSKLNDHNARFCNTDPLLPTMNTRDLCYGSVSKTHMIFGLKCIQGGVSWDSEEGAEGKVPMMATGKSKKTVDDHLTNGVHCLVLRETANEFEQGVKDVMLSENLDNDHNMPEHEIGLLKHVSNEIDIVVKANRLDRDSVSTSASCKSKIHAEVMASVKKALGGRWSDDDITSCFNLVMTSHKRFLQDVVDCHQLYVDGWEFSEFWRTGFLYFRRSSSGGSGVWGSYERTNERTYVRTYAHA